MFLESILFFIIILLLQRNCTSMAKSRNASGTKQTTAPTNDGNVSCLTQKVIPHFLSWVVFVACLFYVYYYEIV